MKLLLLILVLHIAWAQEDVNPRSKDEHKMFILEVLPSSKKAALYFAGKKIADVRFQQEPKELPSEVRLKIQQNKP